MTTMALDESFIHGAVSVERTAAGLEPWRLPHERRHLFPSPDDNLMERAAYASGVRLRLATDATALTLHFQPLPPVPETIPAGHAFDAVVADRIIATVRCPAGATTAHLDGLPGVVKNVELWLPPSCGITLTGLELPDGDSVRPLSDDRPRWITWGSSLTHCVRAGSAARTWPATVARTHGLHLTNLGFGGQCCLDPTVAMLIRDLSADLISLKLGINTINLNMSARLYSALVTASVAIIREGHPCTPLALISPIAYPPRETEPNASGYTMADMRRDMAAVHRRLVAAGDRNLHYVDGLGIFSVADIHDHARDQCHPEAAGIDLMAERFSHLVMPRLRTAGQPILAG